MGGKPNWIEIKNEYITSNISQRKLAEKHDIPYITLRQRAEKEKWYAEKKKNMDKVIAMTAQKTMEKISEKLADSQAESVEAAFPS